MLENSTKPVAVGAPVFPSRTAHNCQRWAKEKTKPERTCEHGEDVGLVLGEELAEGCLALLEVGEVDLVVGRGRGPRGRGVGRGEVEHEVAPAQVERLLAGRVYRSLRRRNVREGDVRESARPSVKAGSCVGRSVQLVFIRAGRKGHDVRIRTSPTMVPKSAKMPFRSSEVASQGTFPTKRVSLGGLRGRLASNGVGAGGELENARRADHVAAGTAGLAVMRERVAGAARRAARSSAERACVRRTAASIFLVLVSWKAGRLRLLFFQKFSETVTPLGT